MRNGIPQPIRPWSRVVLVLPTTLLALVLAGRGGAAPVVGFHEGFPGTSLEGWSSGASISNPGSGGLLGAADGFLLISVPGPFSGNLGAFSSASSYVGDWTAAGITQVRLWLDDVNAQDTLEIHFALGNAISGNFWQCNTGFVPPHGDWAPFTVDLTQPANFSPIGTGAGTFAAALQNVDRILVRHDKAPYAKTPDAVVGDFGLDELLLTDGSVGVAPRGIPARGGPVRLAPPAPNPSAGPVTLRMETSDGSAVRIQVVDALGRVIRHAELSASAPGSRSWTWDGKDDRGVATAAGIYRVRALGAAGGTSRPLVRIH